MEAFPAYTWSALNDEDPAFIRALMIRAIGSPRRDDDEEVDEDVEPAGFSDYGDH